ncbi:2-octaprenyl-3-methyl-6-methoxy-1,4-benzoquinol hydroxylase, partial [Pasteurella multocida subsp. multocida str. Anand1_buffalo]
NIQTCVGCTIQKVEKCGENWQILLANGTTYQAPLIIAADGANSQLRQIANIGTSGWQYRQSCLLITVDTELEHKMSPGNNFSLWTKSLSTIIRQTSLLSLV